MNHIHGEHNNYLQYVVSWLDICDVNPLAVDVCIVCIITTWAETLEKQRTFI